MNYFEFYGIPVSFLPDEEQVKKRFFEFSKKYHPDFFTSQSSEKQSEALDLTTLNTKAFQTLSDFDKRMKYILEINDMVHEGERFELPPDFLMDMMGINEELMELKMKPEEKKISDFKSRIEALLAELYEEARSSIESYNDQSGTKEDLKKVKSYYYKKKYLLRLRQSLDTFGNS